MQCMEFMARYVVDYKRWPTTKDEIFRRLLDAIDGSGGKVALASASSSWSEPRQWTSD